MSAVVALAAIGGGLFSVLGGHDDETTTSTDQAGPSKTSSTTSGPGLAPTAYKLAKPEYLLGGKYRLDSYKTDKDRADGNPSKPDIASDGTIVNAYYDDNGAQELNLFGAYGTIKDPEKQVTKFAGRFGKAVHAPPTKQTPIGFDGDLMKCGSSKPDRTSGAYCVWGDASTVVVVTWKDEAGGPYPSPAEFAEGCSSSSGKILNLVVR